MKNTFIIAVITASFITLISCNKNNVKMKEIAIHNIQEPKSLEEVQSYAIGEWESLSVELRPTEDRTGSGEIQPTYLRRHFNYLSKDKFIGTIRLFGDNYGQLPLMEFEFKGDLKWGEKHPIADGAWKIDYILNEGFGVTPLNPQAAQMLNQALPEGMSPFETNMKKDILGKAFPMFHIVEKQIVSDFDLIYFKNGMLFMGAKHVDGTPFDKVENRPHQLQIPLIRK
ncbi:MAG: hypothetical protein AAF502_19125 [Bacteroidota bacterium]